MLNYLVTVCHTLTCDGSDLETRIYADGQVEIIFDGNLYKSYHHGPLPLDRFESLDVTLP